MNHNAKHNNLKFEIVEDNPDVGYYLYVYNSEGKCIFDYLQDSEKMCKEFALEEFGVPLAIWDSE